MKKRKNNKWKEAVKLVLGLLYPNTCPLCDRLSLEPVCAQCQKEIPFIKEPRCMKCGKELDQDWREYCGDCARTSHYYERGLSLWNHHQVQSSIYRYKYKNRRVYAEFYAKTMAEQFESILKQWEIDLIIPIPLYKKRKKERGYNQAELLANKLGDYLGIPVNKKSLMRIRETKDQKSLSKKERKQNLNGAYALQSDFEPVHTVLLVDDVYTTGATIDSAAKKLKERGVQKVYFLTISVGQGG